MANPLIGELRHETGYTESAGGQGSSGVSEWIVRNTTTTNSASVAYINADSTNGLLTIPSGETWCFEVMVVAREDSGDSAGYVIHGVIENVGGTTALVGSNTATHTSEDTGASTWACTVSADNTNDALQVNITGANSTNINWTGVVRAVRSYNA